MIANTATTVIAEALVLKSHSNHNGLDVSDEWGWAAPVNDWFDDVGDAVGGAVNDGIEIICDIYDGYVC